MSRTTKRIRDRAAATAPRDAAAIPVGVATAAAMALSEVRRDNRNLFSRVRTGESII